MSNRILALLIVVIFFTGLFWVYYYFFVANVGSVVVTVWSLENVRVTLTTEFQYQKVQTCSSSCLFEGIPPVNIRIIADKDGYDTADASFKLERGEKKLVDLMPKKTVVLTTQDAEKDAKIQVLKIKNFVGQDTESGSLTFLGMFQDKGYAYSLESGFTLFAFDDAWTKSNILSIPNVSVSNVDWNEFDGLILLKWDKTNGFLDIVTGVYTKLTLKDSQYIKKGPQANQYIVRTTDGVYLVNTSDSTSLQDGVYNDYVIIAPGKILGLLQKSNTTTMKLLNLAADGKAKLILQDISTHDRRVIYSTDDDLVGVQMYQGKVFVTDATGKSKELQNLEF